MLRIFSSLRAFCAAGLVLVATPSCSQGQTYGILREVWSGIGGTTLPDLTNTAAFPASPSVESLLTNGFEAPVDWADSYGTRLRALLVPPVTGVYSFAIASDDNGVLYLSTDDSPANKVVIATVNSWSSSREFTKEANQLSAGINLTNGRRYYIEAMQKEGGGGDNLAVTWRKPGDAAIVNNTAPIPATNCVPYGLSAPIITANPTNLTVVEGGSAQFRVQLARYLGSVFQWQRNGTNLPDANAATYVLAPVTLADNGSRFSCGIVNSLGQTNSAAALLTVVPDVTRPALVSVGSLGDGDVVSVIFSEPVEPASATNAANYTLNNGVAVLRAAFGVDAQTIVLSTTPLAYGVGYTVTVNNVRDRASTPNTVPPNSQRSFTLSLTPLDISLVVGDREPLGPCSRRTALVISEVMFHPTNRPDGRNLQFVELYNSNPWFEGIGGFRLSGAVDFTFPPGTLIPARSFVVLASRPADVAAVYGLSSVLGPFESGATLPKDSGTLRLRNQQDAILLEFEYASDGRFPPGADGAGHSLVLARPSLGERDPRAWAASDRVGGSPGSQETATANAQRTVVINEILAHTVPPQEDFVELYNYSSNAVNVGGCFLTDDPETNRFRIPTSTVMAAGSCLVFTESQLGFGLKAAGETIYLKNSTGARVLDALRFEAQPQGVSWGRSPNGAPEFNWLLVPTPGSNNARIRLPEVVINEIMYDPIGQSPDDEYFEVFNRGTNAVDLSRWHVRGGISLDLPNGTLLSAGGYLVIAKNATNLLARYANLNAANTLGDYSGSLANRGDSIALSRPEPYVSTNEFGQFITNMLHVVVDEVTYGGGGRWGRWSHGGGSSLELVDAHGHNRLAPNWADSDETSKSAWVTVSATGVLDNGNSDANSLQIMLLGEGECLVDNVTVTPQGGANIVPNSDFENGLTGWYFQGNHWRSSWETSQGYNSAKCLHVRASGRGDPGANRIRIALGGAPSSGQTLTITARVKWLAGWPELLLRLHGGWLEASTNILAVRNLGTPGARNSRAVANAGPAITDVTHRPILPQAGQSVTVVARLQDPDGLSAVFLRYRVDPATNVVTLPMVNNGAGLFSAVLPAQPVGTTVPFSIVASDNAPVPAQSAFPADAPARECLVRWGDPVSTSDLFGTHRLWISQRVITEWSSAEKLSNEPHDCTFVYGTNRVIYNMGACFEGSPWHAPGFDSPVGNQCDYAVSFPADDLFLNDDRIHWVMPGNGCCDGTLQKEQTAYWLAYEIGCPLTYRRHLNLFVNGLRRGSTLVEDSQRPDGDLTEEWYPDHANGDLYKMQFWYEYDDAATSFSAVGFSLGNFTTTGGAKKLARYRWNWAKRAAEDSMNNYTNVYNLVDAVNTNATGQAYTTAVESQVDIDNWFRTLAVEKIVGNGDSWGNGGGQNMYAYKPLQDTWKLLIWDIDFAFASGNATDPLFGFGDSILQRIADHPPFRRAYWRAIHDLANGPMTVARSGPLLDARYNAFLAAGFGVEAQDGIKSYLASRRDYLLQQLATVSCPFDITSNGGLDLTTNRSTMTLTGRAPVGVATVTVNDVAYPLTWSSITNWSLQLMLTGGTNAFTVRGYDSQGNLLANATDSIVVNNTLPFERPQDFIRINEIMFDPRVPEAEFVELLNTSIYTTFDLSGWRFNGLDYEFPAATRMAPRSFLVLAKNRAACAAAYGTNVLVFGEYNGNLQANGETLTLVQPAQGTAGEVVVDKVRYSSDPPWTTNASGTGSSLQLVDVTQDNSRAGAWGVNFISSDPNLWRFASVTATNGTGSRLYLYLNSVGDVYVDDLSLVAGDAPGVGSNYVRGGDFEAPITDNFVVGNNLTNSALSGTVKHAGGSSGHIISTAAGGALNTSIYQDLLPLPALKQLYTLSFWYRYGAAGGTLTVRMPNSTLRVDQSVTPTNVPLGLTSTPGTTNNVTAVLPPFPPLWINEVEPVNLTGRTDASGQAQPWIEIYNVGASNVPLDNLWLSGDYAQLAQWSFPTGAVLRPREFKVVFADGHPERTTAQEWHTSFRLSAGRGGVALSRPYLGQPQVLDYVNYNLLVPDRSYGSYPDGQPFERREFYHATPGSTNDPILPPVTVFINEWMADNNHTVADPADGQHEDWFELYNPDTNAVSLAGYYLTDNLTNKFQFPIPDGYYLPARGTLLVWADGEPQQNQPTSPELHVSFKLDAGGEAIGLFTPDGTAIDAVSFGPQATDVSQGRYPDGTATIKPLTVPTPGAPNLFRLPNTPPLLNPIADAFVTEGQMLAFTVTARDSNQPPQTLIYTLEGSVPAGASLHPQSGFFTWRPSGAQAPSTNTLVVRVTDDGAPPLGDVWSFQVIVWRLPRLFAVTREAGQLRFSCSTYPGQHYQLQSCDDLKTGSWQDLGDPVVASDLTLVISRDLTTPAQRFFRLVQTQ